MREILFRGKRIDNGEWTFGNLEVLNCKLFHIVPFEVNIHTSGIPESVYYNVIPSSVGQYTGLTDKNGKKIFEGDCFKTYCTGLPVYKHIVGYYPEHFAFMARCIEMNTVHYLSDYRTSAIEVIGNIHDNPKLLEVTK